MASNIPLPELETCDIISPDIKFVLSNEKPLMGEGGTQWLRQWKTPNGKMFCSCGKMGDVFVLRFHQGPDFHISKSLRHITSYSEKDVPQTTIRHLLIDQVVPRVLGHMGSLVVHGSAACINGKAVAFIGESGLGKSTLAAYLHKHGHTILTDDCFKLDEDRSTGISITPNYPGVRLFDDSSDEIFARLPRGEVAHYTSKKRLGTRNAKNTAPYPLAAIFSLAAVTEEQLKSVETEPVYGIQRIMKLVQCSFGLYDGTNDELSKHFSKQGSLANSQIPFLKLCYPRRYDQLPNVRQSILEILQIRSDQ